MNINKAIEILFSTPYSTEEGKEMEFYHASMLGIEALKRMKAIRNDPMCVYESLLPGETEK